MAGLRVIGVRHHSPACARLVAGVISEVRPWAVLIEGPSDMNTRLNELSLAHHLPVAIYSYRLSANGGTQCATWAPFCDYSPEWVALKAGGAVGAQVRFIDLPAWHEIFFETSNRYADGTFHTSDALIAVARSYGFDSTDALWDHLFEQQQDPARLEADLARYFAAYRHEAEAQPNDLVREAYMASWVQAMLGQAPAQATVLVVCGGFHKPAIEARVQAGGETPMAVPAVPRASAADGASEDCTGSYLIPMTFRRLDAFAGYASGMPSPAYYQALWQQGQQAWEYMMGLVVASLRSKGQRVSTGDFIAARKNVLALANLRGHIVPLRCDVLDGLCAALVKDALPTPPPWTARGVLAPGTDPMLVEMVAVFSGDRVGRLAPDTPRPPLVADVAAQLAAVGLAWPNAAVPAAKAKVDVEIDVLDPTRLALRHVLYRLRWLDIVGVERVKEANLRRGQMDARERWQLSYTAATETSLIEAGALGASLHDAALTAIRTAISNHTTALAVVALMRDALLAGFAGVAHTLLQQATMAVAHESVFPHAGKALAMLVAMHAQVGSATPIGLGALVVACVHRAQWLLEGETGATRAFAQDEVEAVAALRAALQLDLPEVARVRDDVCRAFDRVTCCAEAPVALRGACLGALWSLPPHVLSDDHMAVDAERARQTIDGIDSAWFGDFLGGLFRTGRDQFLAAELLGSVDRRIDSMTNEQFLIALPGLRRAFSFYPPSERTAIAKRIVAGGKGSAQPLDLRAVEVMVGPAPAPQHFATAQRWFATTVAELAAHGLWPQAEAESGHD